jgi:peptidoglycan hydrolase CwlO-like protein
MVQRTLFWLFLLLFPSSIAFAQPATKADIQALELKLIEKLTETDKRLSSKIEDVDKRLSSKIEDVDKRLTGQIAELDKRMAQLQTKVDEMDKRLTARIDLLFWAMGSLIAVVLAVIALPQVLGYLQGKRERADLQKQIDALSQQVKQQQQEIEELKSRRIIAS